MEKNNIDLFLEWHTFLNNIRKDINNGKVKFSVELTDYDIAVNYVIGIAYRNNYKTLTAEMIYHMIMAFTDVIEEEEDGEE